VSSNLDIAMTADVAAGTSDDSEDRRLNLEIEALRAQSKRHIFYNLAIV
jgi:hypothetical protein